MAALSGVSGTRIVREVFHKARKLRRLLANPVYRHGLRHGVAAAIEHEVVLGGLDARTVIDVGANRGQFALVARRHFPSARILSFEPLPEAGAAYRRVFAGDPCARLTPVALGATEGRAELHRSRHDDSSSLLPIGSLQRTTFPGTDEVAVEWVELRRLDTALHGEELLAPTLCKIDVQGTELEVWKGIGELVDAIDVVLVEVSFVPFYEGQPLFAEVDTALREAQFALQHLYGVDVDVTGTILQANALYRRAPPSPSRD